MKRMLKERQKQIRMKRPANAVTAVVTLQSHNDREQPAGNDQVQVHVHTLYSIVGFIKLLMEGSGQYHLFATCS